MNVSIRLRALASMLLAGHFWAGTAAHSALTTEISIDDSDFLITQVFNQVDSFSFALVFTEVLAPGNYTNPTFDSIAYSVKGTLTSATPSMFPGFNLVRDIGGAEFYSQGSSLNFAVAAGADLTDGVQITDFDYFELDAREVDTGRYHPPVLSFYSDGTGSLLNSNNQGGINGSSGMEVEVDFGEEYIAELSFTPMAVPLPATAWLFPAGLLAGLGWIRRRGTQT